MTEERKNDIIFSCAKVVDNLWTGCEYISDHLESCGYVDKMWMIIHCLSTPTFGDITGLNTLFHFSTAYTTTDTIYLYKINILQIKRSCG